ncbi:hypothetical protein H8K33_12185 [Undibacterium amnicola]|uniref:Uncharacterized protein n=1 Tax=Undibacterium amnicola TaxID=1834038 RepID=A0ABR6XS15_9BURK|nr:hypothetical protein [Undibacterium amnicola]MBC3832274.1 hypothetical protein [Undibacterium amnicola]
MNIENIEGDRRSYDNIYRGVAIYIEANPDHYRGGFAWSLCREENELDCGLALTENEAMAEAQRAIEELDLSHV